MKKLLLFVAAAVLLTVKYIEMIGLMAKYNVAIIVISLTIIASLIILAMALKFLDKKWKMSTAIIAILGLVFAVLWYPYNNAWIHFSWNFLVFTSLFLAFYRMAHYEIKKFPAFSYSFMLIYLLTESISMWRGDTYAPFFLVYLTIIVPMYLAGIEKIRE
ncbi:hypothetical protein AciM339_1485 [Aciduliprofundum sp. MAR08-339]|uniref:hypothetical protein n=1 Tax=Aciduliprofundum sp. (strain MAR08-339) TaxID=673860 RepID=UPI0002A49BFE|nr:hypothetical protein AciM339_1485 [Aciduliprofundum sp. MAR08-339]